MIRGGASRPIIGESKMSPQSKYYRLITLQYECWARGKRAWAKALGAQAKALREEWPELHT